VPPFSLTERSGRTVTRDDLLGKVWVASFFYTTCTAGCSKTTESMQRLQRELAGYPAVTLVSIDLWPEHDTLDVLRQYAANYGADPQRWLFLTGKEPDIDRFVEKGFFQPVQRQGPQADPGNAVVHSFSLMVVDQDGNIRGYVRDGRDEAQVSQLARRVRELAQPISWPAVNAGLNGCCGVLLVLGYVAIRARRITAHKILMLSALAVSAAFLTCYLYYHLAIRRGEPTRFTGPDTARQVYLAILLSHTILAVVVAPLALTITYLGLRDRLAGHVRLARWTLPLWLYVSVTGVVVYVMLYHLYPPA
jgi:protein SCO1/2/putative membrane protein